MLISATETSVFEHGLHRQRRMPVPTIVVPSQHLYILSGICCFKNWAIWKPDRHVRDKLLLHLDVALYILNDFANANGGPTPAISNTYLFAPIFISVKRLV